VRRLLALATVAGAAGLAYAAGYERTAFTLRRFRVPLLPTGHRPIRVLHLSDLHLTPGQRVKQHWVSSLAGIQPDLVVATGDLIAHPDAVAPLANALGGLLDRPGLFVRGSNDYFAPVVKNPARYLLPDDGRRSLDGPRLPTRDLDDRLVSAGWLDLDNARVQMAVRDTVLDVVGTDDAHLEYDRYDAVAGRRAADADVMLGVTHAPYARVLDAMVSDGADMVLAGHTHGGQLCLPGGRALVTNCDLDPARARGLSRHPIDGETWLHVSAGLGTSPTAPVRFACRPEASLLTLVPAVG
jgi:predicted MPP superfamily phosphohydrolase